MRHGGTLLYRCRQCDTVWGPAHVPDLTIALVSIESLGETPREWGICMGKFEIHNCGPGVTGFADLVGGREDSPQ